MDLTTRRYDLDWLRVIAIVAVYAHHLGMPFNGDDFHVMNAESSRLLDDIMVYFEQFRLPLLFLISGTGTVLAFSKRSWKDFLKERSSRLLLPLIFGVMVIVPPQTYYQYIDEYSSYTQVYSSGRFEVNHLWFIENLYVMSVVLIPLILFLRSSRSKGLVRHLEKLASHKTGLLMAGLPLIGFTILLKRYYPSSSAALSNLSQTFYFGYFFISGMVLAQSQVFWEQLKNLRRLHLMAFGISSVLFYVYYLLPNEVIAPYLSITVRWDLWFGLCCLLGWTFVITLLGYGQVYLNKPSKSLKKLNEAIYPFYILHQTVIVVFAYYIVQMDANIPAKMALLLISSFIAITLLYRLLVYPFALMRLLFGMKKK